MWPGSRKGDAPFALCAFSLFALQTTVFQKLREIVLHIVRNCLAYFLYLSPPINKVLHPPSRSFFVGTEIHPSAAHDVDVGEQEWQMSQVIVRIFLKSGKIKMLKTNLVDSIKGILNIARWLIVIANRDLCDKIYLDYRTWIILWS